LSSPLLPERANNKIYKRNWLLVSGEQLELRVFENRLMYRASEPKGREVIVCWKNSLKINFLNFTIPQNGRSYRVPEETA
jgi:hypothetical protein